MESSEVFTIPDELPVIYLTDTVIHPYAVMPLSIQKEESKTAIYHATRGNRLIVAVRAHETDAHSVGTVCRVAKQHGMPDGSLQIIVQGLERVQLIQRAQEDPFVIYHVRLYPDSDASDDATKAMQETVIAQSLRLAPSLPHLPTYIIDAMSSPETPLQAVSIIATFLPISSLQQQQILEANTLQEKFALLHSFLTEKLAQMEKELKKEADKETEEKFLPKIRFGKEIRIGQEISLYPDKFNLGGYLIGTRRQGKSTLLEHQIMQSIKLKNGVVVIDPHGDLLQKICARMPQKLINEGQVLFLDPKDTAHPFGLNIYHCEDKDDPVAVEYTTNLVMDIYKKLWRVEYSQPMVEDVIRMTTLTIIANGMTMLEVPRLLFNDAFRAQLIKKVRNPDVLDFWKIYDNPRSIEREQGGGTVGRRLRAFTSSGILRYIVGQSESALQFREILDSKKIVLIRLYSDLAELTSLIGSTSVSQMLQAALSRSDDDERPVVHLYCDEYSRFATESFAQIIEEAGKYNLIPFIAHQSTGQISEENQDSAIQLGSLIAFRLIGKDAERIADEFNLEPPKLAPTIPRNVLDYIDRHQSDIVKEFVRIYILPMQNALRKREKRETIADLGSFEYDPWHNFGEGETDFKPDNVQEALNAVEHLFYETMRRETIPEPQLRDVMKRMQSLLRFEYFYTCHYLQDTADYEKNKQAIQSRAAATLAQTEPKIAELTKQLTLSDYDLAWDLSNEKGKKTKEEVWANLEERAAKNYALFAPFASVEATIESYKNMLREPLQKWEEEQKQQLQQQGCLRQPKKIDESQAWVNENSRQHNVARLRHALSSDDAFFAYSAEVFVFWENGEEHHMTKEEIVERCNGFKVALEKRGTTEGILQEKREEIKSSLVKLQSEVAKAKADRDRSLARLLQDHQSELRVEKARHDRFYTMLKQVLDILKTPQGKIEATPTIMQTQQTYADKHNEVANKLVHLKQGQAMVKLPTGEFLLEIDPSTTSRADSTKKQQIIAMTRKKYCRPRAEVEEEIRKRQEVHESPLPTRKHPV